MNTKTIRYTLVLATCLVTTLAQAAIIKAVPKGNKRPLKVELPHVGKAIKVVPQGAVGAVKNFAKNTTRNIADQLSGKAFDREMDQLAANIRRSMNQQFMTSEQLEKERYATYIFTDENGTTLSREAGLRTIVFPNIYAAESTPQLMEQFLHLPQARGLQSQYSRMDKLAEQFDGRASYDLLLHSMPLEKLQTDPYAGDLLKMTLHVYELLVQDQYIIQSGLKVDLPVTWNLEFAMEGATLNVIKKVKDPDWVNGRFEDEIFYAPEVDAPGFAAAVKAVSFTEYMVKENKFNFPTFDKNSRSLNYLIVDLWHKLWNDELSPEVGQFLLKDYLYAADAFDIGTLMDQALREYELSSPSATQFVGFNFGLPPETLKQVCDDMSNGIINFTFTDTFNFRLGQAVVLLVRTLPQSPFWKDLDRATQIKVENMRKLLDKVRENTLAQMPKETNANN